ncbi:Zn-ribbon domain-containing OB-fold protein [Jatrophihabitans sp. DSM 45814]
MTVRSEPVLEEYSRPYWDAAAQGTLSIQRCISCDATVFPPYPECLECGSQDLKWIETSGRGVVHSASVVKSEILPGLEDRLPLVCALVSLDDAPDALIPTNIIDAIDVPVLHGTLVELAFEMAGTVALPVFRPRSDEDGGAAA